LVTDGGQIFASPVEVGTTAPDGWSRLTKGQNGQQEGPKFSVYANGKGYFNAAADVTLLGSPDAVEIFTDQAGGRIAFRPAEEADDDVAYQLTRYNEHGADINITGALNALGVDISALEETHFADLEEVDGLIVADVSPLLPSETSADDETVTEDVPAPDDADADTYDCDVGDCDYSTDSERGLAIHQGRSHQDDDSDSDDGTAGDADADDPEPTDAEPSVNGGDERDEIEGSRTVEQDGADVAEVQDLVRRDDIETVQQVADALECGVDNARWRLRDAGVYSAVRDAIDRPGVTS
jgi:hypothetical protein